jgi:hypothetical protein
MAAKRKFKKSKLTPTAKSTVAIAKVAERDVLELKFWNNKLKSTVQGLKKVFEQRKIGEK